MRLLPAVLLALLVAAPAAAQGAPENPVGPASYHAYRLPADTRLADLEGEPQTRAIPSATTLGVQASYVPRKAAEPTLGITRDGTAFYAAGDFDGAAGTLARTELYRSGDGGRTWQERTAQLGGQDMPPATLDPYVHVDQRTDRIFGIELFLGGSYLNISEDGGETWTPSTISAPGVNDHQTFFTGVPPEGDPLAGTPLSEPTWAYYCVNALVDVACSRSIDAGRTFQPLPAPPFVGCVGCQTGHGVVDGEGRVYLPRAEFLSVNGDLSVQVARSDDGGLSWSVHDVADPDVVDSAGRHTSVAVDKAGNVFYVWWDKARLLPWLAVSRDHGETWSAPMMVAPPGVHDVNFPVVTAGDEGRIAIAFPGSSVDDQGDATRPWHAWVVTSTDALSDDPTFHAAPGDDGSDPLHRGSCTNRCSGMFDFIDVEVSPKDGSAWASFTDTCTGRCAAERRSGLATDMRGLAVRTVSGVSLLEQPGAALPGHAAARTARLRAGSPLRLRDVRAPRVRVQRVGGGLRWTADEPVSAEVLVRRGGRLVAEQTSGRPARAGAFATVPGDAEVRATDAAGNVATAG